MGIKSFIPVLPHKGENNTNIIIDKYNISFRLLSQTIKDLRDSYSNAQQRFAGNYTLSGSGGGGGSGGTGIGPGQSNYLAKFSSPLTLSSSIVKEVASVITVNGSQVVTNNLSIGNDHYLGSISSPDAVAISAGGDISLTQNLFLPDDKQVRFGNSLADPDAYIEWDTAEDPDCLKVYASTATGGVAMLFETPVSDTIQFKPGGTETVLIGSSSVDVTGYVAVTDSIYLTANNKYLYGRTTGAEYKELIGLNASDKVEIDGNAIGTVIGGTLTLNTCADAGEDTDKFLVLDGSDTVDYRTGSEVLSDIGASASSHLHDGDTLQHDGVNSDGGAFSFTTTGKVTFNQDIQVSGDDIYDSSGTATISFDGSQNVEIPNGDLEVSDGDITVSNGDYYLKKDKKFYLDYQ